MTGSSDNPGARLDALIEQSSLGTQGARRLRERIPRAEAGSISKLAIHLEISNALGPDNRWHWPASSLLGFLDADSGMRLLAQGRMRRYSAGQTLMRQGDSATSVVVLLEGVVKVTNKTPDGRQALLAIRAGGDILGESTALSGQPHSATVTACNTVTGQVISHDNFLALLQQDTAVSKAMAQAITARLESVTARQIGSPGSRPSARLAWVLGELAARTGDREGDQVTLRWPHTPADLASLALLSVPAAQRALRILRADGVIAMTRHSLTVLDSSELNRIAGT